LVRYSLFVTLLIVIVIIIIRHDWLCGRGPTMARSATGGRGCGCSGGATRAKLLGALEVLVYPNRYVADDRIAHAHTALNLRYLRSGAFHSQHDVETIGEFLNRVGKSAAAHSVNLGDLGALVGHNITQLSDKRFELALFRIRGDDKQYFVDSHQREILLLDLLSLRIAATVALQCQRFG